jgi:hypothetical protein
MRTVVGKPCAVVRERTPLPLIPGRGMACLWGALAPGVLQGRGLKVPVWISKRPADATPALLLALSEGRLLRFFWTTPPDLPCLRERKMRCCLPHKQRRNAFPRVVRNALRSGRNNSSLLPCLRGGLGRGFSVRRTGAASRRGLSVVGLRTMSVVSVGCLYITSVP